ELDGLPGDGEGGLFDGAGRAGESEDAAVVIGVRRKVEDRDAAGAGLGGEGGDDLGPAALAEIGHAFDDHLLDSRINARRPGRYLLAGRNLRSTIPESTGKP